MHEGPSTFKSVELTVEESKLVIQGNVPSMNICIWSALRSNKTVL